MDPKHYFGSTPKSHAKFLLNFDMLAPIIHSMTRKSILSIPHPTKKEMYAFNPLTHVQLKHIAVVLVTHQNLHAIFSSFVPHEIPEAVFWCKYFHYLYHACKRYREYKTFLKTREKKPNDTLSHILHLWKTLHHHAKPLETHTPHDALLINTGAKNALASLKLLPKVVRIVYPHVSKSSSMYKRISFILTTRAAISPRDVTNYNDNILSPEHLSDDNDDDADLEPWDLDAPRRSLDERARTTPGTKRPTFANHLVEVIREKPRMSASELQRKSITIVGDDSEVPAHRFLVCVFNILFGSLRHHRLQFIGPLLGFLLKYYEPLEAYTITQAFVSACCHYAIFPFTTVQFDYFFIAFDQITYTFIN
ncbi:TLD protein [Entamoeba marina]